MNMYILVQKLPVALITIKNIKDETIYIFFFGILKKWILISTLNGFYNFNNRFT